MKVSSAFSTHPDSQIAASQAYAKLLEQLGSTPDIIFMHCTVTMDCDILAATIKKLAPNTPIHGGTSCVGVMTQMGFHCESEKGLALLGIIDPEGAYGVGVADLSQGPEAAAREASQKALLQTRRHGEVPTMVWIVSAPGSEEAILQGIGDVFGPNVPIGGGSSGDNTVSGDWKQFANGSVYKNATVVCVLFPSNGASFAFRSGYEPTTHKAIVTKGEKGAPSMNLTGVLQLWFTMNGLVDNFQSSYPQGGIS